MCPRPCCESGLPGMHLSFVLAVLAYFGGAGRHSSADSSCFSERQLLWLRSGHRIQIQSSLYRVCCSTFSSTVQSPNLLRTKCRQECRNTLSRVSDQSRHEQSCRFDGSERSTYKSKLALSLQLTPVQPAGTFACQWQGLRLASFAVPCKRWPPGNNRSFVPKQRLPAVQRPTPCHEPERGVRANMYSDRSIQRCQAVLPRV